MYDYIDLTNITSTAVKYMNMWAANMSVTWKQHYLILHNAT